MKRTIIESPLKGDYEKNRAYAIRCWHDSRKRGEAPYASHLYIAQPDLLDDTDPEQRRQGMEIGFAWGEAAELVAVYTDLGISEGMALGIARHESNGVPVEYRKIGFVG